MDRKFESHLSHKACSEIDHEIISKVILPIPLIQEGQLSVIGKSMSSKSMNMSTHAMLNKLRCHAYF